MMLGYIAVKSSSATPSYSPAIGVYTSPPLSAASKSGTLLSDSGWRFCQGTNTPRRWAVATCMALIPVPVETRATVCTGSPLTRAISRIPSRP